MTQNCDAIKLIAKRLRETFKGAEFYVPAEHEDFVHIAFHDHYLNEKEILEIDCKIIDKGCDAVIVCVPEGDELQGGRKIEYDFAVKNNIPIVVFKRTDEAINWLTHFIMRGDF
ncbi:hypothetical protein LCGC14_0360300 [marine sediment metagenome]|uniref:Uncharacterized protein n=1 Tax=marine sediment metagenome TaxID=412755 RepID=A0A0F9VVK3_9ZZZZ